MDPAIILGLQLSESEVAYFTTFGSEMTTPDEARAIANNAATVHEKLLLFSHHLLDKKFADYSGYLEDYRFLFLLGLKKTYHAAVLGSQYFSSFKTQVSDKWQEEPWAVNKAYIANFLNDYRGSALKDQNESIFKYFDELPTLMKKIHLKVNDKDVVKELGPTLQVATDTTAQVDGFGKSWNKFRQDVELLHEKTKIAADSATKTYLTDRVKSHGESSKTLSEAMGVYAKVLKDEGVLDYPS